MVIQADGKIVVGGWTGDGFHANAFYDYALARYLPDGTLDAGFGNAGLVITDVGTKTDTASAVEVQPDGKIVLAGDRNDDLVTTVAIARYLENGSLDSSFGAGGVVRTGDVNRLGDVAIQADGRILVAGIGSGSFAFDDDFNMLRYTPDGRLDRSFGLNGRVRTDFETPVDWPRGIALQADGKIVVAGYGISPVLGGALLIARYHAFGDVRPDVKANGADYGVVLSPGDPIRLTISLDPGPRTGQHAAWWLLAETPSGPFTFDFATRTWLPGTSPGFFGPLVSFSNRVVVARPAPAAGSVLFYFGVQVRDGGVGRPELPYYDEVGVTVAAPPN